MGICIDTPGGVVTNSAALIAATPSPGDTFQVRSFRQGANAYLENIILKGAAAHTARVLSPQLHDNVRGITVISAQAPTQFSLPRETGQPLTSADALQVQANSGAADSTVVALQNYYTDLPGAEARLHSWGDIAALVKSIKPLEVDATAGATVGQWNDTLITTTENLLHANTDYAVLGYTVDTAVGAVAIKGADTSNYRIGAPGTTLQDVTADYFVDLDFFHSRPHIPVFNAANAGSTFVSVLDNAAGTAVKVQLILAELSQNLAS